MNSSRTFILPALLDASGVCLGLPFSDGGVIPGHGREDVQHHSASMPALVGGGTGTRQKAVDGALRAFAGQKAEIGAGPMEHVGFTNRDP